MGLPSTSRRLGSFLRMVSGALAAYLVAATGLPVTVGGGAVLDVLNDDRML